MMKRFLSPFLALAISAAPVAMAEEAPAPQYLNIFTAHTKLGHAAEYEAAVETLWAAMKKAGADFPVFASQSMSTPGDYNFVTLLGSMADMDKQGEVFNQVFAQSADALAGLGQASNGNASVIIALRPDLSYQPEEPRLTNEEAPFAYLTILYARPGQQQDLEAVMKAFADLSRSKGIRDGYGVSQNVTGEGPVYAIRTLARSQADYFTQAEKNDAKLGDEAVALRTKAGPMISRIEFSSGISRPDLSYQP